MGLLRARARTSPEAPSQADDRSRDFPALGPDDVYLDAACQSLRPDAVRRAMRAYDTEYPACGGRAAYAWATRVEREVDEVRRRALDRFGLSPRRFSCAFTLNTTYALNLLQQQLPVGRYARVVTTHTEHNAVFLSTITAARRLGVPRLVIERSPDGRLDLSGVDLTDAVVVISAMDNVTGTPTQGLSDLVAAAHARGGIVLVDAAQAAPHDTAALRGLGADALCFSAHKMSGPALGVALVAHDLLQSLDISFLGGGQVATVRGDAPELLPDLHTRLEPGLQAWGEIIGFGAALDWLGAQGAALPERERTLGARLYDGLSQVPHLRMFSPAASTVVSAIPERVDAHRLAVFLSHAGVAARSGHFCAHHWLSEREGLPSLIRFSVGPHSSEHDIDRALEIVGRMLRGL